MKRKHNSKIDELAALANAASEEDVVELVDKFEGFASPLMNPLHDREEMGETFDNLLGYNPIDCYDEQHIRKTLEELKEDADADVSDLIDESEGSIIAEVMDLKLDMLEEQTKKITEAITGWSSDDDANSSFEIDDDEDPDDGLSEDDDEDEDDDDYPRDDD